MVITVDTMNAFKYEQSILDSKWTTTRSIPHLLEANVQSIY